MLKGLQVAGAERGLWDRDGKIDGKKVLLDEMRSVKAPRKRSVGTSTRIWTAANPEGLL